MFLYQSVRPSVYHFSFYTSCFFSLSVVICGQSPAVQCRALLTGAPSSLSPTHSTLMTLPCTPRPLSFSTTLKAWSASQSAPSHSTSTKVSAGNTHVLRLVMHTYSTQTHTLTHTRIHSHTHGMLGLPTASSLLLLAAAASGAWTWLTGNTNSRFFTEFWAQNLLLWVIKTSI